MDGWLQKKGHIISSWKRRFFVLEDRTLSYYETDNLKKKKGEYVLDAESRVVLNTSKPNMFTLYAIGSGGQELELSAKDASEVEEWKQALESARAVFMEELEKTGTGKPAHSRVSHEMQISFEVVARRRGVVLQYEEEVSPASEELSRAARRHLQAFQLVRPPPPEAVRYASEEGEFFSLLLLDPDYPSVQNPLFRERIHWAVVNIPGDSVSDGAEVCTYLPPAPHYGSGAHRFVFLLCRQGPHLACVRSARAYFQHRSPLRSASFMQATPLFRAATGRTLEEVRVAAEGGGLLADFAVAAEAQGQRMSIAAVSVFYSQWDESSDLVHASTPGLSLADCAETRQHPSPAQALSRKLPTHDPAAMMLLGSLVAESASTGLQWIYDQSRLADKVSSEAEGSTVCLPFCSPPQCPFFAYPLGSQGFYHEQVQVFRRSLVVSGEIHEQAQASAYTTFYQDYIKPEGTKQAASDIKKMYVDSLTKTFLSNVQSGKPLAECGINQSESQSLTKVPTLVARYSGDLPTLLSEVPRMVRIWQQKEGAAAASKFCTLMARLLHRVLASRCSPSAALDHLFTTARKQAASRSLADEVEALSEEEVRVLQSVEIMQSELLYKIQDIEGVLSLSTESSDRQKHRVLTAMTCALMVGGSGDGSEAHYRTALAGVALEPADLDMWNACKALAKSTKWAPPAREKGGIPPATAARLLGISCDVHGVFFIVCLLVQICPSYQASVQLNLLLGGDCCARAVLLGALFAAPLYPLPPGEEQQLLQFLPAEEMSRAFYGEGDAVESARKESWIPVDWLGKCSAESLGMVMSDAEVLRVARQEVLLVGGGVSRFAHAMLSALGGGAGRPRVRVVTLTLSEAAAEGCMLERVHADTRAVLLMSGEGGGDVSTEQLQAVIRALEDTGTAARVVLLSSTAAALPPAASELGKHMARVEECLRSSRLVSITVRSPWMLESVFDATKRVREGSLSMFLAPDTRFLSVSMRDVVQAVASLLTDSSCVRDEKSLTFSGLFVCMNEVARALSAVVGKLVKYQQVDTVQAYLDSLTSKSTQSKFEGKALMELCALIEENNDRQQQGGTEGELEGFGVTDQSEGGDLLRVLRYNSYGEVFGDRESEGLSSLEEAMSALPELMTEEKRASTIASSAPKTPLGADIYKGRWCLKKFCNESKFKRRFIRLDRQEPAFSWAKKETAAPKTISLSLCDVEVTPPGGVEFSGEGGEMTALWTISCPKTVEGLKGSGGVDIKMCAGDPESLAQGGGTQEGFEAYVTEWVTRVGAVIDQGMTH